MASDAVAKADALINENAVMIFSKTTCPHCSHSKKILLAKQQEYEAKGTPFSLDVYELNDAPYGDAIQDFLETKSDARTVPRIFVATKPLGGRTDLDKTLKSGAEKPLEKWLKEAVEYTASHQ